MSGDVKEINEQKAMQYFAKLDELVNPGTVLFIIGGSAIALLGAKIRVTADIDVALPYSKIDIAAFIKASIMAGIPVDPGFGYQGAYIEMVRPMMLTLPTPVEGQEIVLFPGKNLTVKTCSAADLAASKLYRCGDQDREDIQFLVQVCGVTFEQVEESVSRLPPRFRDDVLVRDNLENLRMDMAMWREVQQ
jgi:hypothetical protein